MHYNANVSQNGTNRIPFSNGATFYEGSIELPPVRSKVFHGPESTGFRDKQQWSSILRNPQPSAQQRPAPVDHQFPEPVPVQVWVPELVPNQVRVPVLAPNSNFRQHDRSMRPASAANGGRPSYAEWFTVDPGIPVAPHQNGYVKNGDFMTRSFPGSNGSHSSTTIPQRQEMSNQRGAERSHVQANQNRIRVRHDNVISVSASCPAPDRSTNSITEHHQAPPTYVNNAAPNSLNTAYTTNTKMMKPNQIRNPDSDPQSGTRSIPGQNPEPVPLRRPGSNLSSDAQQRSPMAATPTTTMYHPTTVTQQFQASVAHGGANSPRQARGSSRTSSTNDYLDNEDEQRPLSSVFSDHPSLETGTLIVGSDTCSPSLTPTLDDGDGDSRPSTVIAAADGDFAAATRSPSPAAGDLLHDMITWRVLKDITPRQHQAAGMQYQAAEASAAAVSGQERSMENNVLATTSTSNLATSPANAVAERERAEAVTIAGTNELSCLSNSGATSSSGPLLAECSQASASMEQSSQSLDGISGSVFDSFSEHSAIKQNQFPQPSTPSEQQNQSNQFLSQTADLVQEKVIKSPVRASAPQQAMEDSIGSDQEASFYPKAFRQGSSSSRNPTGSTEPSPPSNAQTNNHRDQHFSSAAPSVEKMAEIHHVQRTALVNGHSLNSGGDMQFSHQAVSTPAAASAAWSPPNSGQYSFADHASGNGSSFDENQQFNNTSFNRAQQQSGPWPTAAKSNNAPVAGGPLPPPPPPPPLQTGQPGSGQLLFKPPSALNSSAAADHFDPNRSSVEYPEKESVSQLRAKVEKQLGIAPNTAAPVKRPQPPVQSPPPPSLFSQQFHQAPPSPPPPVPGSQSQPASTEQRPVPPSVTPPGKLPLVNQNHVTNQATPNSFVSELSSQLQSRLQSQPRPEAATQFSPLPTTEDSRSKPPAPPLLLNDFSKTTEQLFNSLRQLSQAEQQEQEQRQQKQLYAKPQLQQPQPQQHYYQQPQPREAQTNLPAQLQTSHCQTSPSAVTSVLDAARQTINSLYSSLSAAQQSTSTATPTSLAPTIAGNVFSGGGGPSLSPKSGVFSPPPPAVPPAPSWTAFSQGIQSVLQLPPDPSGYTPKLTIARGVSPPSGAVLLDQKTTRVGDTVRTETFYAIPYGGDPQKSSYINNMQKQPTTEVNNLGSGSASYSVPSSTYKQPSPLGTDDQRHWYKSMYRKLHQLDKREDDPVIKYKVSDSWMDSVNRAAAQKGSYVDSTSYQRIPGRPSSSYTQDVPPDAAEKPYFMKPFSIATKNQDSRSKSAGRYDSDSQALREVVKGTPATEKYRIQPRRIEDYVPGSSTLAQYELQTPGTATQLTSQQMQQNTSGFSPTSAFNRHASSVKSRPATSIGFSAAPTRDDFDNDAATTRQNQRKDITPPRPEEIHSWYRTIQRGGEIPFGGLRSPAPDRTDSLLRSMLFAECRAQLELALSKRTKDAAVQTYQWLIDCPDVTSASHRPVSFKSSPSHQHSRGGAAMTPLYVCCPHDSHESGVSFDPNFHSRSTSGGGGSRSFQSSPKHRTISTGLYSPVRGTGSGSGLYALERTKNRNHFHVPWFRQRPATSNSRCDSGLPSSVSYPRHLSDVYEQSPSQYGLGDEDLSFYPQHQLKEPQHSSSMTRLQQQHSYSYSQPISRSSSSQPDYDQDDAASYKRLGETTDAEDTETRYWSGSRSNKDYIGYHYDHNRRRHYSDDAGNNRLIEMHYYSDSRADELYDETCAYFRQALNDIENLTKPCSVPVTVETPFGPHFLRRRCADPPPANQIAPAVSLPAEEICGYEVSDSQQHSQFAEYRFQLRNGSVSDSQQQSSSQFVKGLISPSISVDQERVSDSQISYPDMSDDVRLEPPRRELETILSGDGSSETQSLRSHFETFYNESQNIVAADDNDDDKTDKTGFQQGINTKEVVEVEAQTLRASVILNEGRTTAVLGRRRRSRSLPESTAFERWQKQRPMSIHDSKAIFGYTDVYGYEPYQNVAQAKAGLLQTASFIDAEKEPIIPPFPVLDDDDNCSQFNLVTGVCEGHSQAFFCTEHASTLENTSKAPPSNQIAALANQDAPLASDVTNQNRAYDPGADVKTNAKVSEAAAAEPVSRDHERPAPELTNSVRVMDDEVERLLSELAEWNRWYETTSSGLTRSTSLPGFTDSVWRELELGEKEQETTIAEENSRIIGNHLPWYAHYHKLVMMDKNNSRRTIGDGKFTSGSKRLLPGPMRLIKRTNSCGSPSQYQRTDLAQSQVRKDFSLSTATSQSPSVLYTNGQRESILEEERRRKLERELEDQRCRRHGYAPLAPKFDQLMPADRYDRAFESSPKPQSVGEPKYGRALYRFNAETTRELSFNKGDLMQVLRVIDNNWYEAEIRGRIGMVPANYVEISESRASANQNGNVIEGEARVLYNFKGRNIHELNLSKGDTVAVMRRVDANWLEGKNAAGRRGIFPANYVEVVKEPIYAKPETLSPTAALDAGLLGLQEAMSKLLVNGVEHDRSTKRNVTANSQDRLSAPPLSTEKIAALNSAAPSLETYRALYSYSPQNVDELRLCDGDLISVVEKCDDGWFIGTCHRTGRLGTFPGNYVRKI